MGMIWLVLIAFIILFAGFIMVVGSSVLNWTFDEIVPELSNLGDVGGVNMTDTASYTIAPVNTVVQSFTWLSGVLYVMMLVGILGFAVTIRMTASRWLIGFFILLVLMLIMGSIFVSNMYEDFYDGTDELATVMKEHSLLSFMVLYSPTIFTILAFLGGIIIFSGIGEEAYI